MLDIAILLLAVPVGYFAVLPAWWGWRFIFYYWRHSRIIPPAQEPCPNVAVLLCLRGADPSLDACLQGLLHQDYPRYQLHIVIDNQEDMAWRRVHDLLEKGHPPHVQVKVQTLHKPCPTCSLKVCAQLQAVAGLGPEIDIVVLIDADAIPARDWLRALVEPLQDPGIGATSGIRWFAPVDCSWGGILRHFFNAGSYPQMYIYSHPWGGSMALRAEVVRRSSLIQRWCRALCEDSAVKGPVHEMGLKLVFVPAATQINQETIHFAAGLRFVQRQLLCVRLDHVDWPHLFAMNMLNSVAVSALSLLAIAGIVLERWDWVGLGGGILALFAFGMASGLLMGEIMIRRDQRLRGIPSPPLVWSWKIIPMFFFTQFISMHYLWKANFLRQVAWRGIKYAIQGPGDIRMEKYVPYQPPATTSSRHSAV